MAFSFSTMPAIAERLTNWWNHGPQERPCIVCTIPPADYDPVERAARDLERWWTVPELRVTDAMERIEGSTYIGEAVPHHYLDFGSSAMPGILGADMEYINHDTVWPRPVYDSPEEVAEIALDRTNAHYRFIRSLGELSVERAHDHHFIALFALGAPGDTLAALYGTEHLLMDMIDRPEPVHRAMRRLNTIWLECFEEFNGLIARAGNAGSIGWAGVWSPGTTFPMQEDYSYMISTEMFREFCLPHIADFCDAMGNPMYHLDGVGEIPHLDALFELERLKVIQWVPGAGKEPIGQWHDLIAHIISHGRSVQVFAKTEEVAPLVEAVGPRGLLVTITDPSPEHAEYLADRYFR